MIKIASVACLKAYDFDKQPSLYNYTGQYKQPINLWGRSTCNLHNIAAGQVEDAPGLQLRVDLIFVRGRCLERVHIAVDVLLLVLKIEIYLIAQYIKGLQPSPHAALHHNHSPRFCGFFIKNNTQNTQNSYMTHTYVCLA